MLHSLLRWWLLSWLPPWWWLKHSVETLAKSIFPILGLFATLTSLYFLIPIRSYIPHHFLTHIIPTSPNSSDITPFLTLIPLSSHLHISLPFTSTPISPLPHLHSHSNEAPKGVINNNIYWGPREGKAGPLILTAICPSEGCGEHQFFPTSTQSSIGRQRWVSTHFQIWTCTW